MFFIQRQGVSKQKVNLMEEENIPIKCVRICFVQQYKDLIILFLKMVITHPLTN